MSSNLDFDSKLYIRDNQEFTLQKLTGRYIRKWLNVVLYLQPNIIVIIDEKYPRKVLACLLNYQLQLVTRISNKDCKYGIELCYNSPKATSNKKLMQTIFRCKDVTTQLTIIKTFEALISDKKKWEHHMSPCILVEKANYSIDIIKSNHRKVLLTQFLTRISNWYNQFIFKLKLGVLQELCKVAFKNDRNQRKYIYSNYEMEKNQVSGSLRLLNCLNLVFKNHWYTFRHNIFKIHLNKSLLVCQDVVTSIIVQSEMDKAQNIIYHRRNSLSKVLQKIVNKSLLFGWNQIRYTFGYVLKQQKMKKQAATVLLKIIMTLEYLLKSRGFYTLYRNSLDAAAKKSKLYRVISRLERNKLSNAFMAIQRNCIVKNKCISMSVSNLSRVIEKLLIKSKGTSFRLWSTYTKSKLVQEYSIICNNWCEVQEHSMTLIRKVPYCYVSNSLKFIEKKILNRFKCMAWLVLKGRNCPFNTKAGQYISKEQYYNNDLFLSLSDQDHGAKEISDRNGSLNSYSKTLSDNGALDFGNIRERKLSHTGSYSPKNIAHLVSTVQKFYLRYNFRFYRENCLVTEALKASSNDNTHPFIRNPYTGQILTVNQEPIILNNIPNKESNIATKMNEAHAYSSNYKYAYKIVNPSDTNSNNSQLRHTNKFETNLEATPSLTSHSEYSIGLNISTDSNTSKLNTGNQLDTNTSDLNSISEDIIKKKSKKPVKSKKSIKSPKAKLHQK